MTRITDSTTGTVYDFGDSEPVIKVDSRDAGRYAHSSQGRWNELWLFEVEDGYALVDVGKSDIDGESDLYTVTVADSLPGIISSMTRRNNNGVLYLTKTRQEMVSRINRRYGNQVVKL